MKGRLTTTRLLQVCMLFLLVVCAAQVLWWYIDQRVYTRSVEQLLLTHYGKNVQAAEKALLSGESETTVGETYDHLEVADGRVRIAPHVLKKMEDESASRLNRYRWEGGFFLVVIVGAMAVLWKALREEADLRRRQQNFIAAVSHEFKSPLASLQLSAETMRLRQLPQEKTRELIDRMLGDLRRMGDMVARILDASRLEHGRIQLNPEPIDLASTVSSVFKDFEDTAREAGVRLLSSVPSDLEVRADPVAARTVLRNLVDNAVKATEAAKGGQVAVSAARTDGFVRLEVRDDGLGFRPEESARLFLKFYRLGDEMRRKSPGSGLGLFIVKRFMQLEKGRVDAYSEGPGKGSTFAVSWPVARGTST